MRTPFALTGAIGLVASAALAQGSPPLTMLPNNNLPSTLSTGQEVGPQRAMSMPRPDVNYLAAGVAPNPAFGAFQRGYFGTALQEAMKRVSGDHADGPSMTLIGELYREGLGVRTDPAEAARWYKLGAEHGDPGGAFSLALAYLQGRGVEKSRDKAKVYLQQAAAKDRPAALYQLGLMAIDGDIQDFRTAADFFQKAADRGDMDASYALGLLYKEGRGVDKDPARALALIRRAADEHIAAAQVDYAIMLFNGEGTPRDEAGAARYFRQAASANNPVAANRLARLLAAGRGVERNIVEAMKWHILARSAGVRDDWLEGQMSTLSARDRTAVEESVKKQVGN